jgi:hypothetical protein
VLRSFIIRTVRNVFIVCTNKTNMKTFRQFFTELKIKPKSATMNLLLYVGVLESLWLSKGILFLQDNAAPHKAAITHRKLADLHFEVLKHPAYSPDLAPSE